MHTDKHTITINKTIIQQNKLYITQHAYRIHPITIYNNCKQHAHTHTCCKITICSTHTHTHRHIFTTRTTQSHSIAFTIFIICFLIPFSLIFLVFFGMYMYCEWVAAADLTPFTLAVVSATDTCSMAAAVSFAAGLQCAAATAGDIKQIYWSHCLDGKSGHDSPFFSNLPPKLTDVSGLCRRLSLTCSLPQHDLKMSKQYVQPLSPSEATRDAKIVCRSSPFLFASRDNCVDA